jgi:hypothetical protein
MNGFSIGEDSVEIEKDGLIKGHGQGLDKRIHYGLRF